MRSAPHPHTPPPDATGYFWLFFAVSKKKTLQILRVSYSKNQGFSTVDSTSAVERKKQRISKNDKSGFYIGEVKRQIPDRSDTIHRERYLEFTEFVDGVDLRRNTAELRTVDAKALKQTSTVHNFSEFSPVTRS